MEKTMYELFKDAKAGNESAIVEIFSKYNGKIYNMAKSVHGLNGHTAEDIESILRVRLMYVISTLDIEAYADDRGGKLVKYVMTTLKHECYRLFIMKYKQIIEDDIKTDNEPCSEDDYCYIEYEGILDKLTPLQKEIIIGYYVDKYRIVELAEKLGLSRQAISRNKRKAVEAIEEIALKNGLFK